MDHAKGNIGVSRSADSSKRRAIGAESTLPDLNFNLDDSDVLFCDSDKDADDNVSSTGDCYAFPANVKPKINKFVFLNYRGQFRRWKCV